MKLLFNLSVCCLLTVSSALAFEPVVTKIVVPDSKPQTLRVDLTGVDDIYLVATYGGDSYDSDQAIWAEPVLFSNDGNTVRLTSLVPADSRVGWGKLLVDKNNNNEPLSIADEKFTFGFWAHAPSVLHFKLGGKFSRLETKVGLDTGSQRGTVIFQITDKPAAFPEVKEYTKNFRPNEPRVPKVPPVADSEIQFNAAAAKQLLDKGIDELLFIRRMTYNGNHIYVEYVNSTWMPGGGLCALNLKTGKVREIVPEFTRDGVVGWFDVSFDAKRIVFDFKRSNGEGYRIYEVNVDGTNLHQLTFPEPNEAELVRKYQRGYHHGTDDMEPCYLPDGGIVFATTRCQYGVLCDSPDIFTVKNLYRMNGDGSAMKPLTNSPLSEATPTIMSDGRVLYHRWEYVDKAAGNCKALWSMNPDGSGSAEVYGNTISFPETKIQARAIPGEPNKIVMLGASHWINNAVGTVIVVDTTKNIRSTDAMTYVTGDVAAFAHDGFHFKNADGKWYHEKTGKPGRLFRNPYPISTELFLVAHKPKGLVWSEPTGYNLAILDGDGNETVLLKDQTVSLWEPFPLVPREKPPVPTGMQVDSELATKGLARCIVTDVYVGMDNVKRGEVKYLRILEQLPRPWSERKSHGGDGAGMAHTAIGNGFLSVKVQHGIVPVEDDGSAHFVVPANRAIYFQTLDKNLCAIQTERTYVNYNAGETRSCVGCHETPDVVSANANRSAIPKSIMRNPSIPSPQPFQNDAEMVFDYERQIQPILDQHCVACHDGTNGGTNKDGKQMSSVDLRGEAVGVYSVSYNSLIDLAHKRQLLGNRKFRDEDNASNNIEYIPPYQTGALTSPLAAMICGWQRTTLDNAAVNDYAASLRASHKDLRLSDAEKLTITNWLDINCQFHPSYKGHKNVKYKTEPDYRPEIK
ncbi:MAG: NPCBM/NEW2 domain-containing protein [Planctomycetaceae bacterium]|jgi:hypothetical protein|nr:NPCBM/NEW2 domain-containing protein [Planctomycetaceae bacterium]